MENIIETTDDSFLGGKLVLRQPREGYRAGIDPVLLAASVSAKPGEQILDLGCGIGAVMHCLAARVDGVSVVGLEVQGDLVALAEHNIKTNGLEDRLKVIQGDILSLPPALKPDSFHHVVCNPPYMEGDSGNPSPNKIKSTANHEGDATLADWVKAACKLARHKGSVTFIHRADRLEDLMAAFAGTLGDIHVLPLWPKEGAPAKRVIVRGRKGVSSPTKILPGLVMHGADGAYTPEIDAIPRKGAALIIG